MTTIIIGSKPIYESTEWKETSDCDEDADDNIPLKNLHKKSKKKSIDHEWKEGHFIKDENDIFFLPKPEDILLEENIKTLGSELSYFYYLFPVELLHNIVNETMLYSTQQRPEKPINITVYDIEKFIGCVLYMSVIKLPSTRDYWSSSLSVPCVSNLIGVNRLKEIKKLIHFNDNNNIVQEINFINSDRLSISSTKD